MKKAKPNPFAEKMKAAKAKKKATLEDMTKLTDLKLRATLEAVRANPKI